MVRLLKQPQCHDIATEPGVVMLQIDGLSYEQFHRAIKKNRLPFLKRLIGKEEYYALPFYSGLPSATPAVQAEIFYGTKTTVPSFEFIHRKTGNRFTMFLPDAAEKIADALENKGSPLLKDGTSYSNIFIGGAAEARYCAQSLDIQSVLKAVNPLKIFIIMLVHSTKILRIGVYALIELLLAASDFVRGIMERRNFFQELKFIPSRISICIILRELIRFHVKMDVARGVKIVHANLLGYDEQAHRRGPTSAFAHWTLKGIDNVVKDIYKAARRSDCRDYRVIIYSDHGQETVDNYESKYQIPVTQAIEHVFSESMITGTRPKKKKDDRSLTYLYRRAKYMLFKKSYVGLGVVSEQLEKIEVTAMGPLGHVYLPSKLYFNDKKKISQKLVRHARIPLVLFKAQESVTAVTDEGVFDLMDNAEKILGEHHPFLQIASEDFKSLCHHPDAGDLVISGWKAGQNPISFARENGAHGGPGIDETRGFVVLPDKTEQSLTYLRGLDLRKYVLRIFKSKTSLPDIRQKKWTDDGRFRVLSYNIHSCINMDGKLFPERIARVIADLAPDIVALQEVDLGLARSHGMDQARFLADRLCMDYRFFPVVENHSGKYGLALLSRYPICDIKNNLLPTLAKSSKGERRGIMWAKIESPVGLINLLNTHLSFARKERSLQADALIEGTLLTNAQNEPFILCGDLNAVPSSSVYQRLSVHLHDVQCINKQSILPKATFYSGYPFMRIDHIFVSKHFRPIEIQIPDNYDAKMASDHLPVLAELYFKKGDKK